MKMEMPAANDVKVIVDGGTKMVDRAPAPARGGVMCTAHQLGDAF